MKKSKIILLIILLAANLFLVQIFKIKITVQKILILQVFLFSLSFLTDIIRLKFSKNKNITPVYFLMINFLRILLCVVFLLPTILQYNNSEDVYIYNFFIIYFVYLFYGIIFNPKNHIKINM
jgi:hypothetical protein